MSAIQQTLAIIGALIVVISAIGAFTIWLFSRGVNLGVLNYRLAELFEDFKATRNETASKLTLLEASTKRAHERQDETAKTLRKVPKIARVVTEQQRLIETINAKLKIYPSPPKSREPFESHHDEPLISDFPDEGDADEKHDESGDT